MTTIIRRPLSGVLTRLQRATMPVRPSHAQPPSSRPIGARKARLGLLRGRRLARAFERRLALLSGWAWVAAGSLIGFEMLDILLGGFLLAPELLPLVIVALACVWYFRNRLRRAWARGRARMRLIRASRQRMRRRSSRSQR